MHVCTYNTHTYTYNTQVHIQHTHTCTYNTHTCTYTHKCTYNTQIYIQNTHVCTCKMCAHTAHTTEILALGNRVEGSQERIYGGKHKADGPESAVRINKILSSADPILNPTGGPTQV